MKYIFHWRFETTDDTLLKKCIYEDYYKLLDHLLGRLFFFTAIPSVRNLTVLKQKKGFDGRVKEEEDWVSYLFCLVCRVLISRENN